MENVPTIESICMYTHMYARVRGTARGGRERKGGGGRAREGGEGQRKRKGGGEQRAAGDKKGDSGNKDLGAGVWFCTWHLISCE